VSSEDALALTLAVIGGIVVLANILTTYRLWASPLFETPQKIAQTILVWLVPGSVVVVRFFLRDTKRTGGRGSAVSLTMTDAAAAWSIVVGAADHRTGDYGDGGDLGSPGDGDHGGHSRGGGDSGGHGAGGFGGDGGH
jgi:uncharacterized membrane protein YgcG